MSSANSLEPEVQLKMAFLERAKELSVPPPAGSPYGVPLPHSELPGRSAVYRHWRFRDGPLLKTMDPNVGRETATIFWRKKTDLNLISRLPRRMRCLKIQVFRTTTLIQTLLIYLPGLRQPTRNCLGHRPYDKATKTYGPYQWLSYGTVLQRRAIFGVGIVEINKRAGVLGQKYGVGLWCQNRPEWQLTGMMDGLVARILADRIS